MGLAFALVLPGLVVAITIAGVIELLVARRRRAASTRARMPTASAGFDMLGLTLAPGTQHRLEYDETRRMLRDDDSDGAPPRSRVDLDTGVASLVVPTPDEADGSPDSR